MKKLIIPILCMGTLLFTQCSKDDDDSSSDDGTVSLAAKNEMLSAHGWIATAVTVDPAVNFDGILITDYYSLIEPCDQDDIIFYFSDFTGKDDEGASKCSVVDPQTINEFTWSFSSNGSQLNVDLGFGRNRNSKVVELTDNRLTLQRNDLMDGIERTFTIVSEPAN